MKHCSNSRMTRKFEFNEENATICVLNCDFPTFCCSKRTAERCAVADFYDWAELRVAGYPCPSYPSAWLFGATEMIGWSSCRCCVIEQQMTGVDENDEEQRSTQTIRIRSNRTMIIYNSSEIAIRRKVWVSVIE